jgi:hypothetical protein
MKEEGQEYNSEGVGREKGFRGEKFKGMMPQWRKS